MQYQVTVKPDNMDASHVVCDDRNQAETIASALNRLGTVKAEVTFKVWLRKGGSITLPLDQWYRLCETIMENDGTSQGKPSFAAD